MGGGAVSQCVAEGYVDDRGMCIVTCLLCLFKLKVTC